MNKKLFTVLNWVGIGLLLAFLVLPLASRNIPHEDPMPSSLIAIWMFPSNGTGPLSIIVGSVFALAMLTLIVFGILFQIKRMKWMQIGMIFSSIVLVIFYSCSATISVFSIPAAIIGGLTFLLNWSSLLLAIKK
jgi:hypothetical protein